MAIDGRDGRFHTLDAMRGLAAIVVMLWHTTETHPLIGSGYLAVDFFFALSGLVLAKAYEDKLAGGLSWLKFMESRLLRLYPMYFLGMVIGVVAVMAKAIGSHSAPAVPIAPAVSYGIFMLPAVGLQTLFPLNTPSWSLFLEVLINAVFCILLFRFSKKILGIICTISGCIIAYFSFKMGGVDFGFNWETFPLGFIRVTFGFTAGMLIWRTNVSRISEPSWLNLLPMISLIILLVLPVADGWRGAYAAVFVLVVTPSLLVMGAVWQSPRMMQPLCNVLGDLSYPLYAIHRPTLFFAAIPRALNISVTMWAPLMMGGVAAVSWVLGRYIDPYLRGQIRRRLFWRRQRSAI